MEVYMAVEAVLPDKFFYKIGEVSELTALEPYVLRYWESEFNIKLTKTKNAQRLYQKKDVYRILEIKKLLYDEKFTIAGAKKRLREVIKEKNEGTKNQMNLLGSVKSLASDRETLKKIQKEAYEALDILRADSATFDKK
jgi:DNA-binding transcriptional MerR regulator